MEISDLIELFRRANEKNDWGDESYILFLDDGSGEVVSEDSTFADSEGVFEFNTPQDLIEKLNKKLR